MGPVSIGVEVQRNTDGDTPSNTNGVYTDSNIYAHFIFSAGLEKI